MKNLFLLVSPRIYGLKNSIFGTSSAIRRKAIMMVIVGLVFWGLMFILSTRMLIYFQSIEVIGDLLAHHLLSMIFLTFFSLLIFSNIITSLSNLYLSADLEFCHSSPSGLEEVFLSRSIFTFIDSSWMVMIFGLPVIMAYAYVYRPGVGFYLSLIHMGFAVSILATGIGILFTMIMVSIFPAHRTRDIIMLLVLFIIVALYLMFRLLRPERLVDPDAFFSVMQYLTALEAPDLPYMPTRWITDTLWTFLKGSTGENNPFEIALLWSTAGAIVVINIWVAEGIYFKGFSKSQEARRRLGTRGILDLVIGYLKRPVGHDLASLMEKDIRHFFRDNTQWSQLILLAALVVVYLYNFSVLPLERSPIRLEFLQDVISFLNLGLAGFVLSAISVRFIFPAISSEGKSFWIIQSSPISMERLLWGKFFIYIIPMLLLGEILIIVTNYLLNVTAFIMFLSSVTMFLEVFAIVAMGIGFGAIYPNFKHENIAQVPTGFGGLMYMIFSAIFIAVIIILEAGPVYILFMADLRGTRIMWSQWFLIIVSFVMVLFIIAFTIYKSMNMGLRALNRYE
jgi:ABC-2 type transport system permease protein